MFTSQDDRLRDFTPRPTQKSSGLIRGFLGGFIAVASVAAIIIIGLFALPEASAAMKAFTF